MIDNKDSLDIRLDVSPSDYTPTKLIEMQSVSIPDVRLLSFQFMHDGYSVVNASGAHIDVNPAFCQMTGFSREELIGSTPRDSYWPPEELANILHSFSKVLGGEYAEAELVFMRKNGERFPVIVNPFAIQDMEGQTLFHAATVKEVTQRNAVQAALRDSESRYRALFESAVDAITILKDGQIIDCNQRALELTGRSREEMLSLPTTAFFPPTQPNGQDSIQFFAEQLEASRTSGSVVFEWTGLIANGQTVTVEVTLTSFLVGGTRYTQSVMRDITRRKRLEEALRLSERQYRSLFDNAGDGILIMQGEQVLDCNDRVLELYGLTREQLMGLSNYSLSPPTQSNGQSSEEFFAERVSALRDGKPQIFQWTARKFDGTPIETEVTLTALMIDGKPCTQSIIRDTTQRKQLLDALQDSEIRFRTLFESAGDAISINRNSRTVDCNKRLSELYGLTREEILSSTVGEFFPPTQPNGQDSREFFEEKVQAARAGIPQIYEWYGRKRDGTAVITEVTLTSLVLGGEIYEQAIARDITRRKQTDAALRELNRTLEDRVSQRTEELERAYAELLQHNIQYRELAKKLTAAEEGERRRIAQLLHDSHQQLLVAARYRAELLQSDAYTQDVNDVGRQVSEILDQALEATRSLTMELAPPILYGVGLVVALKWLAGWIEEHHDLEVVVNGTLPMTRIPTDVSSLLFQSVRELLLNVVKHAGVKRAAVSVAMYKQQLEIAVTDEGMGFDVTSTQENPRSYGLFSIQERLAVLDGRMEIVSILGRGTTTTLTFPLDISNVVDSNTVAEPAKTVNEINYQRAAGPDPIRILIVDDHKGARDGLAVILGMVEDFDIVGQAVDGLDAVDKARRLRPHLILMDITMPRMNGIEATRLITAEFRGVKVVAYSTHAREDMQPQMLEAGAVAYLHKTMPVDALIASIRDVIQDSAPGA